MTLFSGASVAEALSVPVPLDVAFTSIRTDTRDLEAGSLFVALKGENFDGHDFLQRAKERGAAGAVVRTGTPPVPGFHLFEVEDTRRALGHLAAGTRDRFTGPVIAVTGSNGKTSVKEFMTAAVSTRWRSHSTRENQNNMIGVPLTILDAPEDTEALVVEVGASELGEVAWLREVVRPSVAVVTNVSAAHLEGFGSLEATVREKVSILDGAEVGLVGAEPRSLRDEAQRRSSRAIRVSLASTGDIYPDSYQVGERCRVVLKFMDREFVAPLPGLHQGLNLMFALALIEELDLEPEAVQDAIGSARVATGRCEIIEHRETLILDDSYNANPASVAAALQIAGELRGKRPLVLVLGSMLELGEESRLHHERMANEVVALNPEFIVAVGEFGEAFAPHAKKLGSRLAVARDADEAIERLAGKVQGGELIVLKGSRGVHLERVRSYLTREA
ncbi:MAG: UDP-N-acetylmuramoyl-tripeptide--D-alanyl-D-alanine ligase [Gemmatimonadetes bacterium]|nr:UDP-N-acetylmuramoyl-tripeptide--D-alanyl-D-alanine ligase [Gemmatimonadota bacterium]